MSKPSPRRQPTSQNPARPKPRGSANRRPSGTVGRLQGRRGRLPLLAVLLALAALILVPAVVLADHQVDKPTTPTATTGDRTMTVNWSTTHGATGGYQYRYTDNVLVTLGLADPPEWSGEQISSTNTVTIPAGTLTVGTTYYFQVRGRDNGSPITYGEASDWSTGVEQRAAPAKLANVQAVAGNTEVTLSWNNPDAQLEQP